MEADSDAVRHVFGVVLHHLRTEAGMSLRALAARARYDYSRLCRVEHGEHLPATEWVEGIDTALNAGGLLMLLRSLAPAGAASARRRTTIPLAGLHPDDGQGDSVTLQLRTPDGRTVLVKLSRRQLGELMASGLLRTILPAGVTDPDQADRVAKVLAGDKAVDPQALDYFGRLLTEHFTADKMLGPRQLIGTTVAQIRVLDQLRRTAPPGSTAPVLRLLAQYGEFAGWLHQDLGDTTAARYWSDRAGQWAQATGDYATVAYLMIRKANIALLDNDARDVIELAAAAGKVPGATSPRLQALATQQEARGWALYGDATRFQRKLEHARTLLRDYPTEVEPDAPVYLHQYSLGELDEQSAVGYRACGQAATAVRILEAKIKATGEHLRRDRGHLLAKLANTVLATTDPEPERAIALGMRSASAAQLTGSARICEELRALDSALTARFPTTPGCRELHEVIATLGRNVEGQR
ncbi:helix-turn-helix transcriptional regulator [Micromonospora sp. WMMD980]|uniref:helix-turn-helix domain-containing protein n=1 Tax=Micromonospora sp. WMMD980 TaxID=3016088 RepID=UPI002417CB8F|nr:helix-turn-helix transcriptional regulator [Micromonospora sp. WMMD980]MDG4803689.1 helix-turn-helix transcriptional regulator [Micromonospora sp. WMMD980]